MKRKAIMKKLWKKSLPILLSVSMVGMTVLAAEPSDYFGSGNTVELVVQNDEASEAVSEETVGEEITDAEISDAEISDAEAAGEETTDAEISDAEISDAEAAGEETTDAETTDAETTDAETTDEEITDAEAAGEETTDAETTDAETTDAETTDAEAAGEETTDDEEITDEETAEEEESITDEELTDEELIDELTDEETDVDEESSEEEAEIVEFVDEETGETRYALTASQKFLVEEVGYNTYRIVGYKGTKTELTIPAKLTLSGAEIQIIGIAKDAFKSKSNLTSVSIASGITSVGESAFLGCTSLKKVVLPSTLTSISCGAFRGCTSLASVTVPEGVTYMESDIFRDCISLTSVNVKANKLGSGMFQDCTSLTKVALSGEITTIPSYTFYNCRSLEKITLPTGLTGIGYNSFYNCKSLLTISIPATVTTISDYAFSYCESLTKVTIPRAVTYVGSYMFYHCKELQEATVKTSYVSSYMFEYCEKLTKVTLSDNCTAIKYYAFYDCYALKEITLPETLTELQNYAFYNCTSLTEITIPAAVCSVGTNVFSQSGLRSVVYKGPIIGEYMFSLCRSLEKVTMSSKVAQVRDYAFYYCVALKELTLSKNILSIGQGAFRSCDGLTTITIPTKCTSIEKEAFLYCERLQNVIIPGTVKTIGDDAFRECDALVYVSFADGLQKIGANAFYKSPLKQIYVPKTVTSIGEYAFSGTGLKDVFCEKGSTADKSSYYPGGVVFHYSKMKVTKPTMTVKSGVGGKSVIFSSTTSGAYIYYGDSENITLSSKCVPSGGKVDFTSHDGKLYAKAYYSGTWSDIAIISLVIEKVATPTVSFANGKVTAKTTTTDCILYYTFDGTTPSQTNGTKVKGSSATFAVSGGNTIKVVATRDGFANSKAASAKTTSSVSSKLAVPSFTVKGVFGGRNVTFNGPSGSTVYYSTSSAMSTNDKHVKAGGTVLFENFYGTIYARSYKDGKWSNTARLILKIPVVNEPVISYAGSGYYSLKTSTPSCYIIYTTDGSIPSLTNGKRIATSSTKIYMGYGSVHIKAIAVRSCFTNSSVATYIV